MSIHIVPFTPEPNLSHFSNTAISGDPLPAAPLAQDIRHRTDFRPECELPTHRGRIRAAAHATFGGGVRMLALAPGDLRPGAGA